MAINTLRLILGDQLSHQMSSLTDYDPICDIILMCEVSDEMTYVKHHKKKIAFILSTMRHFAEELKERQYTVHYTKLDDQKNLGSIRAEVEQVLKTYPIDRIIVTQPSEYRVYEDIRTWENDFQISVEIRPDNRFLCAPKDFEIWAKDRKQLRMEYFYRDMRKKYSILMEGETPVGGQWNTDAQNRNPPTNSLRIPKPYDNDHDEITHKVLALVEEYFPDHFGDLHPFSFAVKRDQALDALEMFIEQRLVHFGDYQDAMMEGEPWMYHSHLSFYLNCGLLLPMECIKAAEEAYYKRKAPLNAVEGFIRQIIGWREYVRGVYWLKMPQYANHNYFGAKKKLPDFYWTANTKMNCLRQCIQETKENAYAHHIQRLMVLGNFALLAGIDPKQVNEWFLIVYADAYEWVELPNVSGMILFADGGYLASKPYAAGGSYINKMSNYCKNCSYKITKKNGSDACPFHYLYWDFLQRNRDKLQTNHRIGMMYKTYDKMEDGKKQAIHRDSQTLLNSLI